VVLPVHDINPVGRTPWVTYGLVAANVIVLLLTPGSRSTFTGTTTTAQLCSQHAFFDHYAAIPRELTTDHPLTQVAGSVAYLAHVFGFLTGVVVGLIMRAASPPPQYPVHPRLSQV
jgi:membrane associated rhomboid family serine protease